MTANVLMWGQNAHEIEETEEDGDEVSKLHKQLKEAKQHAWKRWKHEYIHSLLESHQSTGRPVQYRTLRKSC